MSRTLDVYLHDQKAGQLKQSESGQLTFAYDADYLAASGRAISVSMPLTEAPYADDTARPYFSGLLPDERARNRLAAALGISAENAFGLLEVIGGECAGALSLVPEGVGLPDYDAGEPEPLNEKRLAKLLDMLRDRPLLGGEEGVRLSLAGAQDKLAVCLIDGAITLPKDGRPTTHILKPFIEGLEGTVENEVFCMRLAARMGLNAPTVSKASAGQTDFILVERYDRLRDDNGIIRKLHQEDFCQALKIPPELKYEDEGGPGIARCQTLIQQHTARPAADRLAFQNMVIFHYLVGNADAHGKNYSLLYRRDTPDLAPLYDVVCTAAYPRLAKNLAMKIGDRAIPDTIQLEHWNTLVLATKAAQRLLATTMRQMAEGILPEADALLDEMDAEATYHPILKTIRKIIETRVQHVLRITDKTE
jgi:serine/threonine-protein kinase HipA